jgi:hypothetical protein
MATLSIAMVDVPFGATTSVSLNVEGCFDYLKERLFRMDTGAEVLSTQTTRRNPELRLNNLQGNTNYSLWVEAYKLGGVKASQSLSLNIGNDDAPATMSMSLNVPYYLSTVAGNGVADYSGNGVLATSAGMNPWGVACDPQGNIFIADYGSSRIRKVDRSTGIITTVVGGGTALGDGGPAISAALANPHGLTFDSQGNMIIADYGNLRVRKVDKSTGIITTVAGIGPVPPYYNGDGILAINASLYHPTAVACDAQDNIFIADRFNNRIRKVDKSTGIITTVAGNGTAGFSGDGGPAINANLCTPTGVTRRSIPNAPRRCWPQGLAPCSCLAPRRE